MYLYTYTMCIHLHTRNLCTCICISMCIYIYVHMYLFLSETYIHAFYINIYTHTYIHKYVHIHVYIHMYIRVYVYMYIYICMCSEPRRCQPLSLFQRQRPLQDFPQEIQASQVLEARGPWRIPSIPVVPYLEVQSVFGDPPSMAII